MIDPTLATRRHFTTIADASNPELLGELMRRYNQHPDSSLKEAISAFIYAYEAMETAKDFNANGLDPDEAGEQGRPF